MNNTQSCCKINLSFPGNLDYIPAVRKFISEILQIKHFDSKFAYRTEIIVDEICNNAVTYGCVTVDAMVTVSCNITDDSIELTVSDQGGNKQDIEVLRKAIKEKKAHNKVAFEGHFRGLEIVRMLSEKIDLEIDDDNFTSIHVLRRREDE